MSDIVGSLSALSRAEAERDVAVDVEETLETALRIARVEIRHRATLERDIAPGLHVLGDPARFGQVLLNLLVNAAHAIPAGNASGERIYVRTREEPRGFVTVEVRDSGTGMDEATRAKIFDPFFSTKGGVTGVGLGLFVAEGLVRRYGGRMEAENRKGATGARFLVVLPAVKA